MQSQVEAAHQVLAAVKQFRREAKPIVRDACRYYTSKNTSYACKEVETLRFLQFSQFSSRLTP